MILLYAYVLSFFATRKCQKNQNIDQNSYTNEENLHVFQTSRGISMTFLGKMYSYDDIKSHKKSVLYPVSRKCCFGKTTLRGQIDSSPAFQGLGTVKWLKRCTCHDRHISKTIPSISW